MEGRNRTGASPTERNTPLRAVPTSQGHCLARKETEPPPPSLLWPSATLDGINNNARAESGVVEWTPSPRPASSILVDFVSRAQQRALLPWRLQWRRQSRRQILVSPLCSVLLFPLALAGLVWVAHAVALVGLLLQSAMASLLSESTRCLEYI